ncbi:MAG: hypothetical protein NZ928_02435, partial [Endomicrobia bacterium]|nr:hypothetical protein [Endomicrobiia bacterium]
MKKNFFIYFFVISNYVFSATDGIYTVKFKLVEGIWELFDNCDSRKWKTDDWGYNRTPTNLTWGKFFGRDCLQVTSTDTKNAITIWTYTFPPENWSNVELV